MKHILQNENFTSQDQKIKYYGKKICDIEDVVIEISQNEAKREKKTEKQIKWSNIYQSRMWLYRYICQNYMAKIWAF